MPAGVGFRFALGRGHFSPAALIRLTPACWRHAASHTVLPHTAGVSIYAVKPDYQCKESY